MFFLKSFHKLKMENLGNKEFSLIKIILRNQYKIYILLLLKKLRS